MHRFPAPLTALALIAACSPQGTGQDVTRAAQLPSGPPPMSEHHADGTCWAREQTPAIYQEVMGEVQVVQAEIAEDGTLIRPPIYRKGPVPELVKPRSEMTFAAPCPEDMTAEFISSVQRALAARNYFSGNVTGTLDAPTTAAIRQYQAERGLDSAQLSLETARALGLAAVDLTPKSDADAL